MTAGDGWTMMIGAPDEFEAGVHRPSTARGPAPAARSPARHGPLLRGARRRRRDTRPQGRRQLLLLARPEITAAIAASIATTPDAVRTYLAAFEAAGADDVLIVPCSNDLAQLDLLADAALRVPALV